MIFYTKLYLFLNCFPFLIDFLVPTLSWVHVIPVENYCNRRYLVVILVSPRPVKLLIKVLHIHYTRAQEQ